MLSEVIRLYGEYGFLSAKLINDNCDFTYQALSNYYSIREISNACGKDDVFLKHKSAGAKALHVILCEIYGSDNVIEEYSEKWLVNKKTGKRMYCDFYIPALKLSVEYDGEQHDEYIEFIHKNYKNFFEQVYRDRLKEHILLSHGIRTIRIKYDCKMTLETIKDILPNI